MSQTNNNVRMCFFIDVLEHGYENCPFNVTQTRVVMLKKARMTAFDIARSCRYAISVSPCLITEPRYCLTLSVLASMKNFERKTVFIKSVCVGHSELEAGVLRHFRVPLEPEVDQDELMPRTERIMFTLHNQELMLALCQSWFIMETLKSGQTTAEELLRMPLNTVPTWIKHRRRCHQHQPSGSRDVVGQLISVESSSTSLNVTKRSTSNRTGQMKPAVQLDQTTKVNQCARSSSSRASSRKQTAPKKRIVVPHSEVEIIIIPYTKPRPRRPRETNSTSSELNRGVLEEEPLRFDLKDD